MVAPDDATFQTFLQKECTAAEMQQSTFQEICTAKGRTAVHRLRVTMEKLFKRQQASHHCKQKSTI